MLPLDVAQRGGAWERRSTMAQYFRRIVRFRHIDLEYALTQVILLCWRPSEVCVAASRLRPRPPARALMLPVNAHLQLQNDGVEEACV